MSVALRGALASGLAGAAVAATVGLPRVPPQLPAAAGARVIYATRVVPGAPAGFQAGIRTASLISIRIRQRVIR